MTEPEFERLLANAYLAPIDRPEPAGLAAAVLDRVERRRRSHAFVLTVAALVGLGVAALAVVGTGVAGMLGRALANAPPEPAMLDPSIVVAVGFALTLLAAARHVLREL